MPALRVRTPGSSGIESPSVVSLGLIIVSEVAVMSSVQFKAEGIVTFVPSSPLW